MPDSTTTVVIVDDHPVVVEGLRALLEDRRGVHLQAVATNGEEAMAVLRKTAPDVVMLDISLPDSDGTELCLEIRDAVPETAILAISNHDESAIVARMVRNGAKGYVLKNAPPEEILDAIHAVRAGKTFFSSEVQSVLAGTVAGDAPEIPRLTRRETEILQQIADGKTTQEIGDALFISPLTVETHRRNMMQKFEVNNAPALVWAATQMGII